MSTGCSGGHAPPGPRTLRAPSVVADLHRPAAEHVRGPHEQRESHALRRHLGLVGVVCGRAVRGVRDTERREERPEPFPVLGEVDHVHRRPEQPALRLPRATVASFRGVCPPNCTMTPSGCSTSTNVEHVLGGQRLEVQAVGGVVVGRDGLGVAVDHHRVASRLTHGHRARGRSSSRTRSPGRSDSGRRPGSRPTGGLPA